MSDSNQLEISGAVTLAEGNGGLRKVVVETPWSSAEIYLHGAQVTHYQKTGEEPLLFISGSSEFAAEKAIRGGIPIVFPWFGGREGLPSHGFARTVEWKLKETSVHPDGAVSVCLSMPTLGNFTVEYSVTVGKSLTLELSVRNHGEEDSSFESCLHTYFKISALDDISISGLLNTGYFDKVKDAGSLETSPAIRIAGEVDRIYFDTAAAVEIVDPGFNRRIRIDKTGSNSTVVWNPWIEKSIRMADFGDDEYSQMVCVESGNVSKNQITLTPGGCAVMKVEIHSDALA